MFPSEFKELLFAFNSRNVKYLVIGTYAVIVHSHPARYRQCKSRLCGVSELRCAARGPHTRRLIEPGMLFRMGTPPLMVDILPGIKDVDFDSGGTGEWKSL